MRDKQKRRRTFYIVYRYFEKLDKTIFSSSKKFTFNEFDKFLKISTAEKLTNLKKWYQSVLRILDYFINDKTIWQTNIIYMLVTSKLHVVVLSDHLWHFITVENIPYFIITYYYIYCILLSPKYDNDNKACHLIWKSQTFADSL